MRPPFKKIRTVLGTIPMLLLTSSASAADARAEHWDDRHMQTNFWAPRQADAQRAPIQIGVPAAGDARVREQVLSINPHGWTPGGPSTVASASRSTSRSGPPTAAFSSSNGALAVRSTSPRNSSRGESWSGPMRHTSRR